MSDEAFALPESVLVLVLVFVFTAPVASGADEPWRVVTEPC